MSLQRRDFLKLVIAGVGAATVLPQLGYAEERRRGGSAAAGGELPLAEPGKGAAGAVNYVHEKSAVKDAGQKKDRQGVPFAKQSCANCQLYTAHGKKGKDDVGKCTIFQGQVVKASGWCTTWAKKA
jgi:hypothetical protein